MISLTVKADDGETERYGLKVSKLQDGITITNDAISGTLKKVSEYPGFGDEEAMQEGHYLALDFASENADKIVTKVIGGSEKETDLTKDKYCVYRIKEKTQKIEVKATKGDEFTIRTYGLTGLELSDEEA